MLLSVEYAFYGDLYSFLNFIICIWASRLLDFVKSHVSNQQAKFSFKLAHIKVRILWKIIKMNIFRSKLAKRISSNWIWLRKRHSFWNQLTLVRVREEILYEFIRFPLDAFENYFLSTLSLSNLMHFWKSREEKNLKKFVSQFLQKSCWTSCVNVSIRPLRQRQTNWALNGLPSTLHSVPSQDSFCQVSDSRNTLRCSSIFLLQSQKP